MAFPQTLKELCTPSKMYFILSAVVLFVMFLQNLGNTNTYHLGCYSCVVTSTILVFAFKLLYVMFWTWILNLMCKDGHSGISWLLVLFPLILFFVIISIVMISV